MVPPTLNDNRRGAFAVTVLIIGSEGNVGRRLKAAFPGSVGIDRVPGADIVADLADIDYDAAPIRAAFEAAETVIHVGTSPDPEGPDAVQFAAVTQAARLLEACLKYRITRLLLPSSDWADPPPGFAPINTYGYSKRVFEAMAAMYAHATGGTATALRIGWVALDQAQADAADPWLRANYWTTDRLVAEVRKAIDL